MKFAEIIREAGANPADFPRASNISVTLYDEKRRIVRNESIRFVEPLFAHNNFSYSRFINYLHELEENPCPSITVQLGANAVHFFDWGFYRIFLR